MRDLEANIVPLVALPVDEYGTGTYFADIDLAGQARRLALVMDAKLGAGASIDVEIYESDTPFDGVDAETILEDTIDTDGGYGADFTVSKRYITVVFIVKVDDCMISCGGLAYLLRQIPESKSQVQVM